MAIDLTNPIFHDEDKAREHMEGLRWPDGPFCAHCGETDNVHRLEGKSHRKGLIQCNSCLQTFTVTVGSVMERSKIPLAKWVLGFHLMAASKKGVSAHQLHRTLGVTYKTAWFMAHRIREAMRLSPLEPMGGGGGVVEIDETMQGRRAGVPKRKDRRHGIRAAGLGVYGNVVLALVERGGTARTFHVDGTSIADLIPTINANISREAHLMTDAASWYRHMNRDGAFAGHDRVDHSRDEYGRHEPGKPYITTNTVESYFSLFKRGMRGVYQHCSEKHLHRYLAEFDFRYNNRIALGVDDATRAAKIIKGAAGKRLQYRQPRTASANEG